MELRQLEYLIEVADEAGFTRAARRVHVTQSGISAQIRRLERELGVTLFERGAGSVTTTPAGAIAVEHARRVIAETAALTRAVEQVGNVVRGRLDLGVVTAYSGSALFDTLARFNERYAEVKLGVVEGRSADLIDRVRAGDLDIALVGVAENPPDDLDARILLRDRLMIGVTADHALARRVKVTVADVCAHPIICLPTGNGIRAALDRVSDDHGVIAEVTSEASAPGVVADLAVRGLGVAVLSESSLPLSSLPLSSSGSSSSGLVTRLIDDADIHALLALVWRREPMPAVRAWLELADDAGV